MSSQIIMKLYEDSLTFKNFRSWYFIQTASKTKYNKMTLQAKLISCGEKNIAPSKVTDEQRRKRGCLAGNPQA